ncbi:MAG: acetyltransferase [Paludibacter sp.]
MKSLAILGAGGHGKVIADTALLSGWDNVVFFDDAWPNFRFLGPWEVRGHTCKILEHSEEFDGVIVAIGNNLIRLQKQIQLQQVKINIVKIIHPSATVSTFSEIGEGSVVFAGVVVNAFAKIAKGCIINTSATIDHDCVLAEGVHVSPGAHLGGNVRVGKLSWIGIGASVIQGIHIGDNVIVGAGAAVIDDILSNITVAGVPAYQKIPKIKSF